VKTGTEDKKKVAILAGLVIVLIGAGYYELRPSVAPPAPRAAAPAPRPAAQPRTAPAGTADRTPAAPSARSGAAPEAQRLTADSFSFGLHSDKLAMSEDVEYEGTGRNIFSTESTPPVNIEPPASNGRITNQNNASAEVPPGPPQPAPPPTIDLKYFGYEQSRDKSMKAFLVHGDDIFMAKTGEIVDHRYKVGSISVSSIQITDMAYNNTQTLPLMQN
jgi:hypothetical protein